LYNPSIGKFLSVDPLAPSYPWNSTYAFAEGDVIRAIDLDGLEKYIVHNYYNGKNNPEKTTIKLVKDEKGALIEMGGSYLGKKFNDVLIFNIGVPDHKKDEIKRFNMRDNLSSDEQAIISAGADLTRTFKKNPNIGNKTSNQREDNGFGPELGIEFPGSFAPDGRVYKAMFYEGNYAESPTFSNVLVQTPIGNQSLINNLTPELTSTGVTGGVLNAGRPDFQYFSGVNTFNNVIINSLTNIITAGGTLNSVTLTRPAANEVQLAALNSWFNGSFVPAASAATGLSPSQFSFNAPVGSGLGGNITIQAQGTKPENRQIQTGTERILKP
jgi:hypothetical protein